MTTYSPDQILAALHNDDEGLARHFLSTFRPFVDSTVDPSGGAVKSDSTSTETVHASRMDQRAGDR